MIRKMISRITILSAVSFVLFTASAKLAKPTQDSNTVFCGSFIQHWHAKDWDEARWTKELSTIKTIGTEELIVQNIADTKKKYAVYPTKIKGYICNKI